MRFAIYYTPSADDPLTTAAADWLGWNPHDGSSRKTNHGLDALLEAPRRYGFHGTLKAPFRLAPDTNESDLRQRFEVFSQTFEPFEIPSLVIDQIGPFFALVPGEPCPALQELANNAVRVFEAFRAELTEAELAKRKPDTLTDEQRDYLENWGYPYIFDEFRFHMTLTGAVPADQSDTAMHALKRHFADFDGAPHRIDSVSLFVEPEPGAPFHIYQTTRLAA